MVNRMKKIKVIIIRTAGTNCDYELKSAFELCDTVVDKVHINELISSKNKILSYDILAIPGGFSYGDDIASGKILSNEIKYKLGEPETFEQNSTLYYNDSNKFECRWVHLKTQKTNGRSLCLWTNKLPDIITLPVAHGEGKFIADKKVLDEIEKNNQVVFRYCDKDGKCTVYPQDPNGSLNAIAGICNKKGNVFGLMPHPERYIYALQHPSRESFNGVYGWGKQIFQNAIDYLR